MWPRQNGRHFADDTFIHIFLKENVRILIKLLLKFVPKGPINNILVLVQIMAWRRPGDNPLSEPMMVRLPTNKCITRPQWVIHCSLDRFMFEILGKVNLNFDTKTATIDALDKIVGYLTNESKSIAMFCYICLYFF